MRTDRSTGQKRSLYAVVTITTPAYGCRDASNLSAGRWGLDPGAAALLPPAGRGADPLVAGDAGGALWRVPPLGLLIHGRRAEAPRDPTGPAGRRASAVHVPCAST